MPMPDETRKACLCATARAASTLLHDLQFIREIVSSPIVDADQIRRTLTPMIRRIIVDGDISRVANPRIGRIRVLAREFSIPNQLAEASSRSFFASTYIEFVGSNERQKADPISETKPLKFDDFREQEIIFWDGSWLRRRMAIKFVANIIGGVHSDSLAGEDYDLAERLHRCIRYSFADGKMNINADTAILSSTMPEFTYDKNSMSPLLAEVVDTARLLINSPDVIDLENVLLREFSGG